jgi:hypothetical protein
MPNNTIKDTTLTGAWNGSSFTISTIPVIAGINILDQLKIERTFTLPSGSELTQTDFRKIFVIPSGNITLNAAGTAIIAISTPSAITISSGTITVPAIVSGDILRISRKGVSNEALVTWVEGTRLTAKQLNLETTQLLSLTQEILANLEYNYVTATDLEYNFGYKWSTRSWVEGRLGAITTGQTVKTYVDAINTALVAADVVLQGQITTNTNTNNTQNSRLDAVEAINTTQTSNISTVTTRVSPSTSLTGTYSASNLSAAVNALDTRATASEATDATQTSNISALQTKVGTGIITGPIAAGSDLTAAINLVDEYVTASLTTSTNTIFNGHAQGRIVYAGASGAKDSTANLTVTASGTSPTVVTLVGNLTQTGNHVITGNLVQATGTASITGTTGSVFNLTGSFLMTATGSNVATFKGVSTNKLVAFQNASGTEVNALDQYGNLTGRATSSYGASAPTNPIAGTTWYDTTNTALKVYNGTAWTQISTTTLANYVGLAGNESVAGNKTFTSGLGIVTSPGVITYNAATLLYLKGDHATTQFRMEAITGVASPNDSSHLDFWCSEPALTYSGSGIGFNAYKPSSGGSANITQRNVAQGSSYIRSTNTASSSALQFGTGAAGTTPTVKMSLLESGNLAVGGSHTPTVTLDVAGSGKFTGKVLVGPTANYNSFMDSIGLVTNSVPYTNVGSQSVMAAYGTTAVGINLGGGIALGGIWNDTTVPSTFAEVVGIKENATSGDYGGSLQLKTRANGANVTEKMRISSTGNVGINTVNPKAKLDVTYETGGTLTKKIFKSWTQVGVAGFSHQYLKLFRVPLANTDNYNVYNYTIQGTISANRSNDLSVSCSQYVYISKGYVATTYTNAQLEAAVLYGYIGFRPANLADTFSMVKVNDGGVDWVCLYLNCPSAGITSWTFDGTVSMLDDATSAGKHFLDLADPTLSLGPVGYPASTTIPATGLHTALGFTPKQTEINEFAGLSLSLGDGDEVSAYSALTPLMITNNGATNLAIRNSTDNVELINEASTDRGRVGTYTSHAFETRTGNVVRNIIGTDGVHSFGTAQATAPLSITTDGKIQLYNGASKSDAIAFASNQFKFGDITNGLTSSEVGIYAKDNMKLLINNSTAVSLNSTGLVGIGTAASSVPLEHRLHVHGSTNSTLEQASLALTNGVVNKYFNIASYYATGATTGTIKIKIPFGLISSASPVVNMMMKIKLSGFNYQTTVGWTATISTYFWAAGNSWHSSSLTTTGQCPFTSFRLGRDTANSNHGVILLGTTAQAWNYSPISVEQLDIHHNPTTANFSKGWAISLIADETGIDQIVTLTPNIFTNTSNYTGINTTTPNSPLTVAGNMEVTSGNKIISPIVETPVIQSTGTLEFKGDYDAAGGGTADLTINASGVAVFANPPLYNTLALAYSEVAVNAAASSGTGFKFGTGLTNYGGYVVRYIKTGDLVQVEGLITNVATTALALASGAVVLTGLPVPRSGSGAIMSIGLQSFTTVVPMRLNPTNGELIVGAAVTLALGNGTTTGGYIAINFSYHTT